MNHARRRRIPIIPLQQVLVPGPTSLSRRLACTMLINMTLSPRPRNRVPRIRTPQTTQNIRITPTPTGPLRRTRTTKLPRPPTNRRFHLLQCRTQIAGTKLSQKQVHAGYCRRHQRVIHFNDGENRRPDVVPGKVDGRRALGGFDREHFGDSEHSSQGQGAGGDAEGEAGDDGEFGGEAHLEGPDEVDGEEEEEGLVLGVMEGGG